MKILHLDANHPMLLQELNNLGFINDEDYTSAKEAILNIIQEYDGIVIRSRFTIDRHFIDKATNLKFIARVGAGLENIDVAYASQKNIQLIAAPEGNKNAVAEHALGMLLSLFNNLNRADNQVRNGKWLREANRGIELDGKTVGIIGYGNMGKAFARKLQGFNVNVICYDILPDVGDAFAKQVTLQQLQEQTDVLSFHVPLTPETNQMFNRQFIKQFAKPFWLLNTARGKIVNTNDLVEALKNKTVLGAGLDVLEYEKTSFENLFLSDNLPEAFVYLTQADNVILTPHIAGWTHESYLKLAQTIVNKIKAHFC